MPRLRHFSPLLPRAACALLGIALGGFAQAQTPSVPPWQQQNVAPPPDALAPWQRTEPRNAPPRFKPFTRADQNRAAQPQGFAPIPSGAGRTGFDATNARRKQKPAKPQWQSSQARQKRSPRAQANQQPVNDLLRPSIGRVEELQREPPPSPYQAPIPPLDGSLPANAQPGSPPIPDIGAIRKPPPKRKAHADEPTDPYAPLGIRTGTFLLYPAIELIGGYNTNPGALQDPKGALVYSIMPELVAHSNWDRHQLNAELRGSYTGYSPDQEPTLSRPYLNGKVDGRIDISRQTHADLAARLLLSTDNPGSPNLQAGLAKLPVFVTYGGTAGLTHAFNRFELTGKVDAERTVYQSSTLTDGTTVSNADRSYDQIGGALRAGYELKPGVKPFIEASADRRVHDTEFDSSGYARDSKGITGKVGSTFALTNRLTGEIAIGYTRRDYEDVRLNSLSALIGDASLIWEADALNTVKLTGASAIGESTIPGVSGALSRDVGVQLDHAFRRWLIGSLKAGLGWDVYPGFDPTTGADRVDTRYTVGAGVTYKMNRTVQIKGEFRQDWLRSNMVGNDYTASSFMLGIRLQR